MNIKKVDERKLDAFYTKESVANKIVKFVRKEFLGLENVKWLEPSAGDGSFLNALVDNGFNLENITAFDVNPQNKRIVKKDFLEINLKNKNYITIGNPPFGKRSKLALEFLNKCLKNSYLVVFILPNAFKRYLVQKRVIENCRLLYQKDLEKFAFIFNKKEYDVNCVFQIWCNDDNKIDGIKSRLLKNDLRRKENNEKYLNEIVKTYIHNNTKETLKYFEREKYEWDFAVYRQGYYDYSKKFYNCNELFRNRQYFFVKILDENFREKIMNVDFEKLSKRNTKIPGYSKIDFYDELDRLINIGE